jgi:hypothetical protein
LPWIALEAVEQSLYQSSKQEPISLLPEERQERIKVLLQSIDAKLLGKSIQKYFTECKWIFVLDRTLYERYLQELRMLIHTYSQPNSELNML